MGWPAGGPDPGRTGVREGERGDQKKIPPVLREGVEAWAVVRGNGEKGG